jgi:acyl dehydratase
MLQDAAPGAIVAEGNSGMITREMLALYAQASGDLNPLHLDPGFARKAGFEDVIVHGMLGMALLGRLLSEHFAQERLRGFSARFVGIVPVGESLQCRARLDSLDNGMAGLALEAVTSQGAIAITGQAQVLLN